MRPNIPDHIWHKVQAVAAQRGLTVTELLLQDYGTISTNPFSVKKKL